MTVNLPAAKSHAERTELGLILISALFALASGKCEQAKRDDQSSILGVVVEAISAQSLTTNNEPQFFWLEWRISVKLTQFQLLD